MPCGASRASFHAISAAKVTIMAKNKLCTTDIRIATDAQVNAALDASAGKFFDPCAVVYCYTENAVGAAREILQGGREGAYDVEIKVNYDSKTGDVHILDNCSGMTLEELKGVCERVFTSKKAGTAGTGSGWGFGIHAFRSCFKEAIIRTKTRTGSVLELTLKRGAENIRGNAIYELQGKDAEFPCESGTWVHLSGLEPVAERAPKLSFEGLRDYMGARYGNARKNPHLRIAVLKDWSEEAEDEGTPLFEVSRSIRLR